MSKASKKLQKAITRLCPAANVEGDEQTAATVDAGFDYVLAGLANAGIFDRIALVSKGGTAIRKFVLGYEHRYSMDLDFNIPEEHTRGDVAQMIADVVKTLPADPFHFSVKPRGRHYDLIMNTDMFGGIEYPAKLDLVKRRPILQARLLRPVRTALHRHHPFDFEAPIAVMDIRENIAEKLCRWRLVPFIRDLHDFSALDDTIKENLQVISQIYMLRTLDDNKFKGSESDATHNIETLSAITDSYKVSSFEPSMLYGPTFSEEDIPHIIDDNLSRMREIARLVDDVATQELWQSAIRNEEVRWRILDQLHREDRDVDADHVQWAHSLRAEQSTQSSTSNQTAVLCAQPLKSGGYCKRTLLASVCPDHPQSPGSKAVRHRKT